MSNKTELAKLPKEAVNVLFDIYTDKKDPNLIVEVVPDPQVEGTYAIRVHRSDIYNGGVDIIELLWNKEEMDEVEFTQWPPVSGNLQFF